MQSLSAKIFSLLSVAFFVIGAILRIVAPLINYSVGINIAFYICLVIGTVSVFASSTKENNDKNAFNFETEKHLKIFAYVSAIGFFIDFVHQALLVYSAVQSNEYRTIATFVALCVSVVMALASSFYLFTVGMSYGDYGYDFRKLKLLHIAPIVWAISNVLGIMSEAISPLKDVNSTVKYATLIVAVLYYYFFAKEVDNEDNAKKAFIVFSRLFPYFALTLFIDRIILLLSQKVELLDKNSILGISFALISVFAFFHQRSIKKGA